MAVYAVYATRWDDPHVVEEMLPARGLQFSMPLSDHGEASFSATVEPGRSFWRPSISPPMSGLLIERDGVPVWCGWVISEQQTGPRTFSFRAVEWGAFFERVPAVARTYSGWNDHALFRDLISRAAAISGQDPGITYGSTLGNSASDLTIDPWDTGMVEARFRSLAESDGGPEWYFGCGGTHEAPTRPLVLGDRLGHTTPQTVLEYVETTEDWEGPGAPPSITLLGDLFPIGTAVPTIGGAGGRRGGNVIATSRTRDTGASATQAIAVGSGQEKAQIRETAVSSRLLAAGWPRMTKSTAYSDVVRRDTLRRHATADLNAAAGIVTSHSFVTLDGDPDWTLAPRGSSIRAYLDTDIYADYRPVQITSRLLNTTVNVDDDGPAQIQWDIAEVLTT